MPDGASVPLLSLRGVSKSYGGVRALADGTLDLHRGRITALLGENGAGKSTLVKIVTGIVSPDNGEMVLDGAPLRIDSSEHARRLGISAMFQEPVVFDALSVAENIFISDRPTRRILPGLRRVDWPAMVERARTLLRELDPTIDPRRPMRELSVAQRHLVQIARALAVDSRIIIMDEPTAALSHREAAELFAIARRLRDEGRAILFISHRFDEIRNLCDRYSVFRDGAAVGSGNLSDATDDALLRLMVGREVSQVFPEAAVPIGAEVLRVERLGRAGEFADVSFTVRAGEILGVYGLVGAGRSEVMRALFGVSPADTGRILLDGRELHLRAAADAIRHGIAMVPEDRAREGAHLKLSITENVTLPGLDRYGRALLRPSRERAAAAREADALFLRMRDLDQRVSELSGGNQQKVVIGKWMATAPRVLILDEPTKGIDVGAKAQVHRLTGELAAAGVAIVMVSSELPEVLGMADRVLVMRRGRVRGLLSRADATPERVVRLATDA